MFSVADAAAATVENRTWFPQPCLVWMIAVVIGIAEDNIRDRNVYSQNAMHGWPEGPTKVMNTV